MKLNDFLQANATHNNKYRFLLINSSQSVCLTKKEANIIACLIEGLRAKQIAHKLDASLHTINTQLAILKTKLNCGNIFELGLLLGRLNLDSDLT